MRPKWIKVEDRTPPADEAVLVYHADEHVICRGFLNVEPADNEDGWVETMVSDMGDEYTAIYPVTHWAEMPDGPEQV